MQTADTLAYLLGTWDLKREIDDRRAGSSGLFEGRVTIVGTDSGVTSPVRGRALYEESGQLRLGASLTRASRTLVYERLDSASLMMHFADGRPFADLNLQSGEWRSLHHCGEDHYELTTSVISESVLQERWRVTGPGKDYVALTRLSRVFGHR